VNTGGVGGMLSQQKDATESATSEKFGDLLKQIQARYGQKPEKPREIKKTLGKDDFLRIMITQMKNQDPTNPFKAEQMATQIAQFTSVEQLQNVNQNLNKMATQNKPLEQMTMTNMIGKVVTIDRERFPHVEGENEQLSFLLPKDAKTVHVNIMTDLGEVVYEKDLGPQQAGEVGFIWDGSKANTLPAKAGNYVYRVTAKDDREQSISISPQVQGKVIGVSFENSEPVFLVGDSKRQDKVTMRNIARIEIDPGQASPGSGTGARAGAGATVPGIALGGGALAGNSKQDKIAANPNQNSNGSHFIPFPKELVGNQSEEKGFPNGLHE
jgi:flagellar basal-body rod modification protein FlgD